MRKVQGERLQRMRGKVWSEMAGRADPGDPTKVIAPSPEMLNNLIGTALKIETREATLFGLDAPTKSAVEPVFTGHAVDEEEMARQWDRLTNEEQEFLMMLLQKLQGRLVEPLPAIENGSIETTGAPVITDPRISEKRIGKSLA